MASVKAMQTDLRKLNRKKKIKKKFLKLLAVTVFLLIALAVWLTRSKWLPFFDGIAGRAGDIIVNDGEIDGGNFPLSFGETSQVVLMSSDENIRLLTDTHIATYDKSGERLSSIQHGYVTPIIKSSGRKSIIYDLGGYSFMVMSKNKTAYTKTLEDQILYANVSEDGCCAVVTKTDKYISFLTIYDEYGDAVFNWSGGKRIIDVSFTGESSGCHVTTISAKGGVLLSQVTALDFSKEEILFETDMSDTLVIESESCTNNDFWCIGDDRLFRVSSKGEIIYRYDYPDTIMCYDVSGEVAAFSFKSAIRDKYTLVLVADKDESKPFTIESDDEIKSIKCVLDTVYVLTTKQLLTFDKSGDSVATADIENSYSDIAVIDDYVYLLGYHKIDRMNFIT